MQKRLLVFAVLCVFAISVFLTVGCCPLTTTSKDSTSIDLDAISTTVKEPKPPVYNNKPIHNKTKHKIYDTIQEAIDDASDGDVIMVVPGEYILDEKIVVDKEIKLYGARRNKDPRGGRSGRESTLIGAYNEPVFDIQASNVEINGFKIIGQVNNGGVNIVQEASEEYYSKNIEISYNIITNQGSTMNEAIKIRTGIAPEIKYNYIYNTQSPGDAINFDRVEGGVIAFNKIENNSSGNAAIYVYNSTNTRIEGNLVDGTTQNDGIKLGSKDGSDAQGIGGSILNNVIRNTAQDGIAIYMSNVVVKGNDVSGSGSENGAIYLAYGISNIIIEDNVIHDNTLNTYKHPDAAGIFIEDRVNASTVKINNNEIYNNTPYGVTNKAADCVDARNNWWGDASGPYHETENPDGAGDRVSDNVLFEPWKETP